MKVIDSVNKRLGMRKGVRDEEISKNVRVVDISNMTEEQKKKVIEDSWQHILKNDQK